MTTLECPTSLRDKYTEYVWGVGEDGVPDFFRREANVWTGAVSWYVADRRFYRITKLTGMAYRWTPCDAPRAVAVGADDENRE